jgi:hypothetical protein
MPDSEHDDAKAPFQIRDFRVKTRKLGLRCASKAGLTMPEWADRAFHSQARIDEGENIFPPVGKAPIPAGNDDALIALLNAAAALAAANDRQLRAVPGLTSLVAERVRAARGLAPRPKPAINVKLELKPARTGMVFDGVKQTSGNRQTSAKTADFGDVFAGHNGVNHEVNS